MHLQTANDLLLCIEELDLKALMSQKDYYSSSNQVDSSRYGKRGEDFSAGMRVYDISDPANPRRSASWRCEGLGLHRIWWTGGRYAYASALLDGFLDHILISIDMADPTKPREVGRWWIPGMNAAAGETPTWKGRWALHHAVVQDDIAYALLARRRPDDPGREGPDEHLADRPSQLVPSVTAAAPTAPCRCMTADLLIVADEATLNIDQEQMKRTWIFDIREKSNPISIATMPTPSDQDYIKLGGQFGPHNLHENRPGSFRVLDYDLCDMAERRGAGVRHRRSVSPGGNRLFRSASADKWMEPMRGRAKVRHTADLFVARGWADVRDRLRCRAVHPAVERGAGVIGHGR